MLLPFVRELFVDVQKLPAFARVASHLKEGTGRIRVSGLIPTAKALLLVLFQRSAQRPLIFVVKDNHAVEEFLPVLRGFCELTSACDPDSIVALPARDVLPFQNLSPHPELQEERATASMENCHRRCIHRRLAGRCNRDSTPLQRITTPISPAPSVAANPSISILSSPISTPSAIPPPT